MPYCRRCGTKLDETARYCHKCGTPVVTFVLPAPAAPIKSVKPLRKEPLAIAAIALVAILVVAMIVVAILIIPFGEFNFNQTTPNNQQAINALNLNQNFSAQNSKIALDIQKPATFQFVDRQASERNVLKQLF